MKIAHVSDLHIDERGRLEDVVSVLNAFLDAATAAAVDLIVIAGDHFERRSTATERSAFADFLQRSATIAPVLSVRGNHDALGDLEVFNRLRTDRRVVILERPTAMPESAPLIDLDRGGVVGFVAVPWFDRAHLVAGLDASVNQGQTREITISAARQLLTAVRYEAQRVRSVGAIPILVGHVMVAGSEVSSGQTLIGTSVELSPADLLEVGAAYAALGHVHKAQAWFDGRVAYSGSPNRCNFGEREAKGWRLVTLTDAGEFASNEFMELPARRIELLEADFTEPLALAHLKEHGVGACFAFSEARVKGALVRFRYHVAAKDLAIVDAAAIEKILLADGAAEVKVEAIVESSTRARAPEIVKLQTIAEKVDSYLEAKEIAVDDAMRERLHAKVGTLEGGAGASL